MILREKERWKTKLTRSLKKHEYILKRFQWYLYYPEINLVLNNSGKAYYFFSFQVCYAFFPPCVNYTY